MSGATPGSYWSAANVSPALGLALARALAALHSVSCAAVWPTALGDARRNVAQMLQQSAAQWRTCEPGRCAALERGYDWLSARLPCIDGDAVAVHGDVHFGNLLAEAEQLTCITDWEFAHPGHPAEDLAFCRSYIESIMHWDEFLLEYRRGGGRSVTVQQLQFFSVWTYLRNLSFATFMRARLMDGAPADLQSLVIALDAQPRLEALLHSALTV
jgi:aminoglycoside phosphotransferase (APT) family kinase protein